MHQNDKDCTLIAGYLLEAYRRNTQAEVSSIEVSHALGIAREMADTCFAELVTLGWAAGDLFPQIIWVRLTAQGAREIERRAES